ncbi:DUF3967 domain-containing protein [Priestia megaterium]|uniref:DUF3967 domain-containing protein n=1 Tax=Priestia megaterium TaxID=1404 RepID=UPI001F1FC47C|nr:DUF3967 domain-containing protein [Priestia megaterium]MCF8891253.1 DUF3967 domain-containing protein [Priestia megaterium]
MLDAKLGQEPAYWTSEVAKKLEVSDSTLRKWCIQLEATGYKFVKGENDSRAFTKHDLNALQLFKQIVKVQRKTKEVASLEVVERYGARQGTSPMQPAQMAVQAHEFKDKIDDMAQSIEEIKKQLHEQMKFNQELLKQIQQRDEYISKKLENRDRELLDAVKGIQETQKFIAASEEKKKKWWEFWK